MDVVSEIESSATVSYTSNFLPVQLLYTTHYTVPATRAKSIADTERSVICFEEKRLSQEQSVTSECEEETAPRSPHIVRLTKDLALYNDSPIRLARRY